MRRQILLESRLFFKDKIVETFEECLKGICKSTLLKISQTFLAHRSVNVVDYIGTFISHENSGVSRKSVGIRIQVSDTEKEGVKPGFRCIC